MLQDQWGTLRVVTVIDAPRIKIIDGISSISRAL
jgi:hypothetical protein